MGMRDSADKRKAKKANSEEKAGRTAVQPNTTRPGLDVQARVAIWTPNVRNDVWFRGFMLHVVCACVVEDLGSLSELV